MKYRAILVLILGVFLLLYAIKGIVSLDSDFGWHIRMGQIILQHGIPKTDPFTYTMPSYPFVDHEWLLDIVIAKSYPYIGMIGLAFFFAFLATTAFFIQVWRKPSHSDILLLILVYASVFTFTGVRMQILTWFLFSVLLLILSSDNKSILMQLSPVLLMFIWANLHGGFPMGLVLMSLFYVMQWIQRKKIIIRHILIILFSVAVTFVNPYGYMLWWEEWMVFSDPNLRFSILEWMPAFMFINITLWMYVVLSVTMTLRYRRKFSTVQQAIYIVFLIAGISSYRHMPLWILASIHPTIIASDLFYQEIRKYQYGPERLRVFFNILITLALCTFGWEVCLFFTGNRQNSEKQAYPASAIRYVRNHLPQGNIFSTYEWGGYLDWKLPQKRVFIDGRIPSSRRTTAPLHESEYAFREYKKAMYGTRKDFYKIMKKYNVEILILPKPEEYKKSFIDKTLENLFQRYIQPPKPKENKFADFTIIYQDKNTIVYKIKEKN